MDTLRSTTTEGATRAQALRSDARKNRDLLIEAAYELLGERGSKVPLHAIARSAGVGIATLHRHFATRRELVEAVLEAKGGGFLMKVEAALSQEDPQIALRSFIDLIVEPENDDRVFGVIFLSDDLWSDGTRTVRDQIWSRLEQVIERARLEGALCNEFTSTDLGFVLVSLSAIAEATRDATAPIWQRHLGWLLRGAGNAAANAQIESPPVATP